MTFCETTTTKTENVTRQEPITYNVEEKKQLEILTLKIDSKKSWISWKTIDYDSLPSWYKDNEFLRTGYRPPLYSYKECFKSILSMHTETGNIWSHLFGCFLFLVLFITYHYSYNEVHGFEDKVVISLFYFSAIFCFGASTLYHTMIPHSHDTMTAFCKIDYAGIALMNIGGFVPPIYFLFHKYTIIQFWYLSIIISLGSACIYLSLSDKFSEVEYRPLRAAVFLALGCFAFVPILHYLYLYGVEKFVINGFLNLMTMFFIDVLGAILYVTRVPERYFPGKCDYWFQSHQLFHVCVLIGAIVHNQCINIMASNCYSDNVCFLQITAQLSNSSINHLEF
uniref:ADIPOR-like receptor IZH2 n=1 Tax=Parastrongyloides trichosuri TaxID=131310 RepID=A0A0N4ZBY6_PARTI